MALNFNFQACNLPEDELWVQDDVSHRLAPKYDQLVWLTLVVDIGHISDEVMAQEFYDRGRFYESLFGPIYYDADGNSLLSLETCQRAIGLRTNVITKSRTQWIKRWSGMNWFHYDKCPTIKTKKTK